jgi:hypothetical protein
MAYTMFWNPSPHYEIHWLKLNGWTSLQVDNLDMISDNIMRQYGINWFEACVRSRLSAEGTQRI